MPVAALLAILTKPLTAMRKDLPLPEIPQPEVLFVLCASAMLQPATSALSSPSARVASRSKLSPPGLSTTRV